MPFSIICCIIVHFFRVFVIYLLGNISIVILWFFWCSKRAQWLLSFYWVLRCLVLALTLLKKLHPPCVDMVVWFHLSSHPFYFVLYGQLEMWKSDTYVMRYPVIRFLIGQLQGSNLLSQNFLSLVAIWGGIGS